MMLGKRKRDAVVARRIQIEEDPTNINSSDDTAHDLFRKYFEAKFDPLPDSRRSDSYLEEDETASESGEQEVEIDCEDDEDTSESDSVTSEWSGLSDAGGQTPPVEIEVVDYGTHGGASETDLVTKAYQKAFMSSKPPRNTDKPPASKKETPEDVEEEKTNLKYDLDLQRLLRESHLLEQSKTSLTPGKQRHKATDMRLQSLGSQTSIFKQEKMPLSHVIGIRNKAASKESLRRRHAQENGIILEKASKSGSGRSAPKRDRGVDAPALGKFRGGTLKLSRADISSIQGPSRGGKKKGRR